MQGKDRLERFIAENSEAFDTEVPNKRNWNAIESELGFNDNRHRQNTSWYWKAAVFLLLGAVGFLLVDKYDFKVSNDQVSNLQKFEELETFYSSLIANKEERLASETPNREASVYLEVEIKELDEIYSDLKEMFLESQPSEQVMERLVHLLRQKLHVIDSQLERIEKQKIPEGVEDSAEISM